MNVGEMGGRVELLIIRGVIAVVGLPVLALLMKIGFSGCFERISF
jgi:hypothetical protein